MSQHIANLTPDFNDSLSSFFSLYTEGCSVETYCSSGKIFGFRCHPDTKISASAIWLISVLTLWLLYNIVAQPTHMFPRSTQVSLHNHSLGINHLQYVPRSDCKRAIFVRQTTVSC